MKLPRYFSTVTTFSKLLVTLIVILLMIIGLILVIQYQKSITFYETYYYPISNVFQNQNECESTTGKVCIDQQCDYKCPKDFQKGWVVSEKKLSSAVSITDEVVDWQTYRNDEYGFEFKYPAGWHVKTQYDGISTEITNESYSDGTYKHDISVSIVAYPNLGKQQVSKEWLINWMKQIPITMPQNWEREIQSTSFLGSPAVTYDNTIYFARDEQIYSIGWSVEGTAIDDSANKSNELVSSAKAFYNQILTTFRFVDESIPKRDPSIINISLSNQTQTLSSDLNLLVTAPDGKKSGKDPRTGNVYDEIQGASSGSELLCGDPGPGDSRPPFCMSEIVFNYIHPQRGKYSIQVISLTQDTISLDPRVIDIHGEFIDFMQYPEYALSSDIGVNQAIEYILDYDNEEISKSTLTLVDDK